GAVGRESYAVPLADPVDDLAQAGRAPLGRRAARSVEPEELHGAGDHLAVRVAADEDRDALSRKGVPHEEESAVPEGEDERLALREHAIDRLSARIADAHGRPYETDEPVRRVGNDPLDGLRESHAGRIIQKARARSAPLPRRSRRARLRAP